VVTRGVDNAYTRLELGKLFQKLPTVGTAERFQSFGINGLDLDQTRMIRNRYKELFEALTDPDLTERGHICNLAGIE
jgi:hypothetical protein